MCVPLICLANKILPENLLVYLISNSANFHTHKQTRLFSVTFCKLATNFNSVLEIFQKKPLEDTLENGGTAGFTK